MKRLDIVHQQSSFIGLFDDERKQIRDSLLAYIEKIPAKTSDSESFEYNRSLPSSKFKWIQNIFGKK